MDRSFALHQSSHECSMHRERARYRVSGHAVVITRGNCSNLTVSSFVGTPQVGADGRGFVSIQLSASVIRDQTTRFSTVCNAVAFISLQYCDIKLKLPCGTVVKLLLGDWRESLTRFILLSVIIESDTPMKIVMLERSSWTYNKLHMSYHDIVSIIIAKTSDDIAPNSQNTIKHYIK